MKNSNPEITKFEIEFDENNMCEILRYLEFIDGLITKKEKVPARVLKKFISLFILFDKKKFAQTHINGCYKYLKKYDYDFHTRVNIGIDYYIDEKGKAHNILKPKRKYKTYSSEDMLEEVITKFINSKNFNELLKNDVKAIQYMHELNQNYINKFTRERPTNYKLHVISGFIASKFGLLYSRKEHFEKSRNAIGYRQYLFRSVRNILTRRYYKISL